MDIGGSNASIEGDTQLSLGNSMAPEPTTDSARCHLWLDPVITAAIDAKRGEKTRPAFILETVAKALKVEGYKPRGRGYQGPKKEA